MADKDGRRKPKALSTVEEAQASSSNRVQLEVSILASGSDDTNAALADEPSGARESLRTVLVISAEADMRTYVRRCLRWHKGIRVVESVDGMAMREDPETAPPDLIIIDVAVADPMRAPLRAGPTLARVPLIVITDEEPGDSAARPMGGEAPGTILVKPFNARQLCGEVELFLDLTSPSEPGDLAME